MVSGLRWQVIGVAMCLSAETQAQPAPVSPAAPPVTNVPAPHLFVPQLEPADWWFGVAMEFLPVGSIEQNISAAMGSFDMSPTVAFATLLDYAASPQVSVGLEPRAIFGVKPQDSFSAAKQFDLRIRVAVGSYVGRRTRLYGFGAPGYSVMFLPREPDGRKFHPHGLIAGFGGGLAYTLSARLAVTFELGFQLGYQGTLAYKKDATFQDNFLDLGFGLITAL